MPIILPDGSSLFDESNAHELVGDGSVVFAGGEHRYLSLRPRHEHPRFAAYGSIPGVRDFSGFTKIPRDEWHDRVAEMERTQSRISDLIDFEAKNQLRTNFCWGNGPCQGLDTVRRIEGSPFVESSAASVCCKINGYVNQGGFGADAVHFLANTGACSVALWPNTAISRAYDTPASQADRANRQAVAWIDVPARDFDALATCLLLRRPCPVGYNWWSHEVLACDLVEISPNVWGIRIRNSWGQWGDTNKWGQYGFSVLSEAKGTPDDCQAIEVATAA